MQAQVVHLNPEGMHKNPAFSQAVVVHGPGKTLYVGGQNSVDEHGEVVSKGDIAGQTRQALHNLETVVNAAGGRLDQVVKWTIFVAQGQSAQAGFEAFNEVWQGRAEPPAITVAVVPAFARPDFLVEIEAVAFIPD